MQYYQRGKEKRVSISTNKSFKSSKSGDMLGSVAQTML